MKLIIEVPSNTSIELPVEMAGIAASLMASGRAVVREGWNTPARYKPCDEGLTLSYVADDRVQPETEREADLARQLNAKNAEWAKAYTAGNEKDKTIKAMQEQLDLLKQATVCTVSVPESGDVAADSVEPDGVEID